jgi:hypothetical protein
MGRKQKPFRCISIVEIYRNPEYSWCIKYQAALYEAKARQRDGVLTWRRIQLLDVPRWANAYKYLVKKALYLARNRKIKFDSKVRHGQLLNMTDIELLATACEV